MSSSQDALLRTLGSNAAFEGIAFEAVQLGGLDAVAATTIPPERAIALWRAARACCADAFWPLLTDDNHVHPYIAPVEAVAPLTLQRVRTARECVVRAFDEASAALDAIATALPQPEPVDDERDEFLQEPRYTRLSLVLVEASMFDAVRLFTRDAEGTMPRHAELVAMLRHLNQQYGAEPLAAESGTLELTVSRPPGERDLEALRALARDLFLLSMGNRDGYGIEDPAHLLRRLTADRWVVWWYGTWD